VWSIKEARETLERLVGAMDDWGTFDVYLERYLATPELRRSVRASSFTASWNWPAKGCSNSARMKSSNPSTCAAAAPLPNRQECQTCLRQ
jgi:segregation and condensation protein A